jgi:hypothetical protein
MLSYVMVLLIALAVGAAVYVLVLRLGADSGPPTDVGEWSSAPSPPTAPAESRAVPEGNYVPVAPSTPSWHSRLGGVMGLVIAVTAAALGIAAGLYLIGHVVAHLIQSAGP